ncbi:TNT domain-containing protein [Mycobacteroides abscessus]|uniref:TNT domain-containing protein n=1 Tax=Mycobacteroides abscessus TaxID=36809 RepID=UPI00355BEE98
MSLPLADIKRAKVQSFRDVADALDGMAGANRDMKRGVERLPIMGDGWKGVSGEAAHHDLDAHGKYLDGHAQAQQSAAAKIRAAADEFEGVQQLLKKIENDAAQGKFTINYDTGEVTPPSGKYDKNELDYLTNTLRQISAAGGVANADLEAAVKAAQTLPDPSGAVAQGLPAMPGSAIKPGGVAAGLEHLAAPDPNGDPGATKAAAAGADTQANYKEWYPKTPGPGDKLTIDPSKAGSLTGTVGALEKLPGAPKPADGFGSGVARQFGQGVNSRVDGIIDEAKNLTGQGGPGSPGVAESWAKFALGTADQMANPLGSLPGEVKDAVNDPAGFAGKKLFDVSSIAATGPLGGEAAAGARGLLGDLTGAETRALTHGIDDAAPGHHPAPSGDHPAPPGADHTPISGDHSAGPEQNSGIHTGAGSSTPVPGWDYGLAPNDAFKHLATPADDIARLTNGGVPSHITEGYDQLAGRSINQFEHEFTVPGRDGSPRWDWAKQAPNDGFAGIPSVSDHFPKGYQLDRLGSEQGAFMADDGAPLSTRSMPPGVASQYHQYAGTGQPIPPGVPWEVRHGPAGPAFGQPGGANQWVVIDKSTGEQVSVEELIDAGLIR